MINQVLEYLGTLPKLHQPRRSQCTPELRVKDILRVGGSATAGWGELLLRVEGTATAGAVALLEVFALMRCCVITCVIQITLEDTLNLREIPYLMEYFP